ncbi:hypothetical protein A2U01_0076978, partial [Trifolium medium]|nr:hypothetical protein [Trifolium medium]
MNLTGLCLAALAERDSTSQGSKMKDRCGSSVVTTMMRDTIFFVNDAVAAEKHLENTECEKRIIS